MAETDLKFINAYGNEFMKFDDVMNYDASFLQGYFYDLRNLKKMALMDSNRPPDAYFNQLNDVTLQVYKRACELDFWWELSFLRINVKKAGGSIRLEPNEGQQVLIDAIKRQEAAGVPVRAIILKPRQIGFSTLVSAYIYLKVKRLLNSRGLVIADIEPNALNLFQMYQTYYMFDATKRAGELGQRALVYNADSASIDDYIENYDPDNLADLLPDDDDKLLKKVNSGYIKINSGFSKTGGGRSHTFQYLHCSELAYWESVSSVSTSLLQTIPFLPETALFVESTANGEGFFKDMWDGGYENYERVFISWLQHSEYQLPINYNDDEDKRIEDSLDEDEVRLIKDHSATLEQLKWRRHKISELQNNKNLFLQEYPTIPEEAFLRSGRRVFGIDIIKQHEKNIAEWRQGHKKYIKKYNIKYVADNRRMEIVREKGGLLHVYKKPKKNHEYVVGVDVADGIQISHHNKESDYSVIEVFDRGRYGNRQDMPLTQVAEYVNRIEPDELAGILHLVAEWYNNAWVCIESNQHGNAVITGLAKEYKKIMRRPNPELLEKRNYSGRKFSRWMDRRASGATRKLGWMTTSLTRPILLDDLGRLIRNNEIMIYSSEAIKQLKTFIVDKSGKQIAASGKHDDIIFGIGLAVQADMWCPRRAGHVRDDKEKSTDEQMDALVNLKPGESFGGLNYVE